jgi:hypothetical protein
MNVVNILMQAGKGYGKERIYKFAHSKMNLSEYVIRIIKITKKNINESNDLKIFKIILTSKSKLTNFCKIKTFIL